MLGPSRPLAIAHPDDGGLHTYVRRSVADDPNARVGSVLVNPGGPGFGGSDFVNYAGQVFDSKVLDAFDIIGFDPRGTGLSEPAIDCVDDYDHFYAGTDITPDDDTERQQIIDLAEEFADARVANNAEIIQFVGTNNAARDMDSIRRALGEEEISFFGLSYGSELGGTWATRFPTTVRAAVFDGAPDPDADQLQVALLQVEGFEEALTTYLAQRSADPGCAFHNDGDAEGAFDDLMLKIDATPIREQPCATTAAASPSTGTPPTSSPHSSPAPHAETPPSTFGATDPRHRTSAPSDRALHASVTRQQRTVDRCIACVSTFRRYEHFLRTQTSPRHSESAFYVVITPLSSR